MTERAVEIIIQVKYDGISKEVKTSIGLDKLVTGMSRINKGCQQALATTLLEVTEESLHARVPKSWKNLGTAKRSLLGSVAYFV